MKIRCHNPYVILCEIDKLRIPTKQLFDLYDEGKGVLFHTAEGDVYIPPYFYGYKTLAPLTFMFENIYEYETAVFEFADSTQILTDWDLKLLELFHIDWYNELQKFLKSTTFVDILREVATLRTTQHVTPDKSEVFTNFKSPILETEIPLTLTMSNDESHEQLWQPFLNIVKQIKLKYELNRS